MTSTLARIFGMKGETQPSPQFAIQKLIDTAEMLEKKTEFIEKKIEIEIATAKKCGMKNKRGALNALKRKKRLETQLTQIDGTLSIIEFQREALENAQSNAEVLKIMSLAAKALKHAQQNLDVDDVYRTMDDIQEQRDIADEITKAISQPVGFQDVDEDELLQELEELQQEDVVKELIEGGTPSHQLPGLENLPEVPTGIQKQKVQDDDEDMRMLAEWAF
ncbi:charged multivesicular body protein 4b-like [Dysidea avara]|uniref:charged multivesicular body protein 4b-like n=1 Tax=Dysidea avara TaxID=196820 RepID=UPI00333086E5